MITLSLEAFAKSLPQYCEKVTTPFQNRIVELEKVNKEAYNKLHFIHTYANGFV
jgi:hypothetical protein